MLQVIHHTAPNVIKKMGKKIPETLYFTGFPAIEATGFVLRSAPVVAERASTGRAATTPSAAQIPCQSDSVVLTNKKPEIPCGISGFLFVEATGFEPTTSASRTQRSTKLSHASKYINGNDSFSLSANVIIQNLERVVNRKITRHIRRLPSRP